MGGWEATIQVINFNFFFSLVKFHSSLFYDKIIWLPLAFQKIMSYRPLFLARQNSCSDWSTRCVFDGKYGMDRVYFRIRFMRAFVDIVRACVYRAIGQDGVPAGCTACRSHTGEILLFITTARSRYDLSLVVDKARMALYHCALWQARLSDLNSKRKNFLLLINLQYF